MSYILEALRKSEHARRQGQVPDLGTVPVMMVRTPPESPTFRLGLAVAAFAALLVVAVLGWWRPWVPSDARPEAAIVAPPLVAHRPVADPPAAPDAGPVLQGNPPSVALTTPPPVAATVESPPVAPPPAAALPAPPVQSLAPAAMSSPPAAPAPTAQQAPAAASPRGDAPPLQSAPVVRVEAAPRNVPAPPPHVPAAAPAPAPAPAPATAVAPDHADRIYSVHELPVTVRTALPSVTVSGYSYADEADRRMAVINDKLVQEGDTAAPGVTLARIGPDGVVLEFQGYRYRPLP